MTDRHEMWYIVLFEILNDQFVNFIGNSLNRPGNLKVGKPYHVHIFTDGSRDQHMKSLIQKALDQISIKIELS